VKNSFLEKAFFNLFKIQQNSVYEDYSDETCFIFEIYLLVDHSKMLVFVRHYKKLFQP